jgi:putative salt-induced outer membrane protein YdiY
VKHVGTHRTAYHILLLVLVAVPICRADQVTLDNGDHLTGTIKKLGSGKLVIRTEYAGDVTVDVKRITSLQTDSDVTVLLDDDTRLYGRLRGDGQKLEIVDSGQQVQVTRVSKLEPGRLTGEEWKFSGRVAIGASESSGNTNERNLNWDAEFVARQDKNRYTLGGRGLYGSDEGVQTDNETLIYAQYDRFVSKKWYGYANANFENDKFDDIQLRAVGGGGVGYQWFDTDQTKLALEAGPAYVYANYYTQETEQFGALRLVTKVDYWLWKDAVQFYNYNELYPSLTKNFDDSFARVQIGFRVPLVAKFMAILGLNFAWDKDPPAGKVPLDRTAIFSLTYQWP